MNDIIYFFGGIVFYFLLDLLKAYYKKKIENEAKTEDLPVMTRVSEDVKQEFRKELSDINAQLSILTNQSSLVDEKSIQVLNSFFERCLEIKDLHSQNFGDFAGKDLAQTLIDYQTVVKKAHRKLYSDYHNLVLFHIKNKEIVENANDIVASNHLIKSTFKKHFGKIKMSIIQEMESINSLGYKEAVERANKITHDYYVDQKSNFDLFNKNFNSLLKSLSKYFSEYGLNYDYEGLKK
jgi:hypothetical protein